MASAAFRKGDRTESSPGAIAPAVNAQKCVLLIEDDEEAMFLVRMALHEHGRGMYRLEWADGLSCGLERLQKGGVDIVLLDLGYAWAHQVAQEIPVLVLTGDTREETESAVTACGVDDYLIKDQISGSLLLQAIRQALRASRRKLHAASPDDAVPAPRSFIPMRPRCPN